MLQGWVIVLTSFAYLGLLFAIAFYADRRADAGRSIIASPYVYSLSLAVYATAWTFYGSVGRAASDGVGFLPIYIGPTLMIALWWLVMRKILRISRQNRITSLADFIASRYGKSAVIGGLVTVIAVIGILRYTSRHLKAISSSYSILVQYPEVVMPDQPGALTVGGDTAFWVALILAAFTILFGPRHLDAAEHHQGMVAAIAFESLVKLLAFLAVGVFVTFGLYNGFGDLFGRAAAEPRLAAMMTPIEGVAGSYASWGWLTILSMMAIVLILLLGFLYFKLAGEAYALVSIGVISFAAVAQFAPVVLGGIFWKGGPRNGALCGLIAGSLVWLYTLLLPAIARSGWLPLGLLEQGPFGIELLKPLALFGLAGLDQITHAMIWSMIANIGAYVAVSLLASPSAEEHRQASLFVDVFRQSGETGGARFWRGTASVPELYNLLARFLGADAADEAFREYAAARSLRWPLDRADAELV